MVGVTERIRLRRCFLNNPNVEVKKGLVDSPRRVCWGKRPTSLWEVLELRTLTAHKPQGLCGVTVNESARTGIRE